MNGNKNGVSYKAVKANKRLDEFSPEEKEKKE